MYRVQHIYRSWRLIDPHAEDERDLAVRGPFHCQRSATGNGGSCIRVRRNHRMSSVRDEVQTNLVRASVLVGGMDEFGRESHR